MRTLGALTLLSVLVCVAVPLHAVGQADATKAGGAVTNAPGRIPQSNFDESIGRDPFFPRRSVAAIPKPEASEFRASDFVLKGITPFGAKPTAVINGYTFEKGESHEVKIPGGAKVMVRVIDIKEESVVITVENSPQSVELRMRGGF